jgi:transcriptional regulator with XRE-family HTH domain
MDHNAMAKEELQRVGNLLKLARREAHVDQQTLADLAGLSRRPISQAENADGGTRLESLVRMLAALGLRITFERMPEE